VSHAQGSGAKQMRHMNPFDPHSQPDRYQIWQRLVAADCEAFATSNWSMIENDFEAEVFEGIRCAQSTNPDDWKIAFPDLPSYRDSWLAAAKEFRDKKFARLTHLEALLERTHLDKIDIHGDRALAHKKFHGDVPYEDGSILADRRQTLFRLHRRKSEWKIVGFFGQLPLDRE
jgi:hypothetical protein